MKSIEYLQKLISLQSFSTIENTEIIDYLKSVLSPVVQEIKCIKNANNDKMNLLVGVNTPLENVQNAIILSGHIDTVIADESKYLTNPYLGVIKDDKIFGLGSIDMKSFFACILANLESIKKLNAPIILAITSDEETDFKGVDSLTSEMKKLNIQPKLTIVGEPTKSEIYSESKSCMLYKIDVESKSCHSSMPTNGINANYIIANLCLHIEKLCTKFENTVCSSTIIYGGKADNIIPGSATMYFDVRTGLIENINKVLASVNKKMKFLEKKYLGCNLSISNTVSVLPLEKKNPEFITKLCSLLDVPETQFVGGCEAGYYQALGGDAIVFGVGDLTLAHKPNEFAEIPELTSFYEKLEKIINFVIEN